MKIDFKALMKDVTMKASEHSPEIMTGLGIAFMLGGAVASVVATVKTMRAASEIKDKKLREIAPSDEDLQWLSDEQLEEYNEIASSPLSVRDVAPVTWKYWVLPVASEVIGAGFAAFSTKKCMQKIGALTGALAYKIAENADYKEAAKEVLGEKKEKEVEEKAEEKRAERLVDDNGVPINIIYTGTGDDLFYDYYGGRFFTSSMNFIERQVNDLYRDFLCSVKDGDSVIRDGRLRIRQRISAAHITLNEFYDKIPNLGRIGLGDDFGWSSASEGIQLEYGDENAKYLGNGKCYYTIKFKGGPDGLDYLIDLP